jgi:hypothetical protein
MIIFNENVEKLINKSLELQQGKKCIINYRFGKI